ncbi:1-(5-phosphoribosyl)-5-[(5-phosphoribosylamino)methylideneamino]imidazole-4-carboxamide isomerase [Pontibacter akesuensis]|uniref:1-(5-phosphoribosyl)-5-[(5-phosphoribosylamino)methylideneamino] imidazole-4-carboxamide isomerase n=1 Tax=Pontibacter akesuensis TaxID=388950 RepID=A0A1I7G7R6_9BACT|nr:1-(5-phosphoribosyl)-5-[(5-phosphoribosylamino)methylideneamino]imidazole-4-carboxamide isomerase [Pontibacter akesuensis]GHA58361.1 1-(5-phosphoribosyl)-5-[(5-phosphoribosylamino) methylideneamino] imidazole-4-carboxamide isomerase [Pontibacter akesuensis]SFU44391.1 1-(5-phosphoribosyl)-5-[(5-phosphoribosylamino)methylideneamino] imidazole-4-carboxamide isomerase [Pontibacter akesuensis]
MMEIIPAIDLIGGQCVRLTEGDFAQQTTYDSNPLEVAKRFESHGIKRLHLVDLDGARARKPVNLHVLESIAANTSLTIDFGGGLQSEEAVKQAFDAGAAQITAGSIAVREPDLVKSWLLTYGPDKIIIGADFKGTNIAISAWTEESKYPLQEFMSGYLETGARLFICTDVSKDGKLQGPSTNTYRHLKLTLPAADVIASGGVTTVQDLEELQEIGVTGAIIGKAIYEGTIELKDLERFLC